MTADIIEMPVVIKARREWFEAERAYVIGHILGDGEVGYIINRLAEELEKFRARDDQKFQFTNMYLRDREARISDNRGWFLSKCRDLLREKWWLTHGDPWEVGS